MKKKIIKKICVCFVISISFIYSVSFAKYFDVLYGNVKAEILNPIFIVENENKYEGRISSINGNYYETTFNVLNYILQGNITQINEVDIEYTIKIIPSTLDFPVKYKLVSVDNNEEILLNQNLETMPIVLGKELKQCNYKLIVEWDKDNTNQDLAEKLDIQIQVIGVQRND